MEHEKRLKAALADRYQIEREIGSGGMATVYLAEDLKHHRKVAVKVLDPDLAQTLGAERFLREIRTAANLTHPHILPVHDSGEADGFLFYVMPYVKGESLRSRLTKERQLPVGEAIQITREIADALAYAHEEGVVHRDVKPANIMLEAGHAVLADFGVAHAVAEAKEGRITRTGTSLGTPAYMSPEQAAGEKDLDGRSDQYALGCVFYEMLAGHPPFAGAQMEAILRQHLTEEPPSVTQARPSVTDEVAKVINRSLAKSPADRFKTTGEMAAALALTTSPSGRAPKVSAGIVKIGLPAAALILVILVWALFRGPSETAGPPASSELESVAEALNQEPGIAVLPFENRSDLSSDAYFADGIQDDLLTRLQRVSGLRVISRTSSDAYDGSQKTIPEIGRELGVGYVLEGSVQRAGDQVHINAQLIDAVTEDHLWADSYDRLLTTENLFEIQSEIVRTVAGELDIELREEERLRAVRRSTTDLEAYDLYLRGVDAGSASGEAISRFQEAIERDPGFLSAYVALAIGHAYQYQMGLRAEERGAASLAAAERALELAPESDDAQMAMGIYLYRVKRDFEAALDWFDQASGTLRGDYDYHRYRGYSERRLGRWRQAIGSLEAAVALSPREPSVRRELGLTYLCMRRYSEAEKAFEEAARLAPDDEDLSRMALLRWLRDGTTDGWGPFLERNPTSLPGWEVAMTEGRYQDAAAVLDGLPDVIPNPNYLYPKPLLRAETMDALGQHEAARQSFQDAASILETMIREEPDDERRHASLAWAYAGLMMGEEAVGEAQTAVAILPRERDAFQGPNRLFDLASVYARLGEVDKALAVLEDLLSAPAQFSPQMLEHHFRLRPIQDDPRFKALMDREKDRVF